MSDEDRIDASDRRKVRAAAKQETRLDEQVDNDYREVLATAAGRRLLGRLVFEECAVDQTSFHSSGQQFAANEGRRGVGAQLQGEIMKASLEAWIALVREHHARSKS